MTVHVPNSRIPEFYRRFGEFMGDAPEAAGALTTLPLGAAPNWVSTDGALTLASEFWAQVPDSGRDVLRSLIVGALEDETRHYSGTEIAAATNNPKGKSSVAGIFGVVGKAVKRAGLPMYQTERGTPWHYVWEWDGDLYWMNPAMAQLLRAAGA